MEATHNTLAVIQWAMPSTLGCTPWGYAQIAPGEQISSHLHGMGLDSLATPRRLARITVVGHKPIHLYDRETTVPDEYNASSSRT